LWFYWAKDSLENRTPEDKEHFMEKSVAILQSLADRRCSASNDYLLTLLHLVRCLERDFPDSKHRARIFEVIKDLAPLFSQTKEPAVLVLAWEIQLMSSQTPMQFNQYFDIGEVFTENPELLEGFLATTWQYFGHNPPLFLKSAGLQKTLDILTLLCSTPIGHEELSRWFGFFATSLEVSPLVLLPGSVPTSILSRLHDQIRSFKKSANPNLAAQVKRLLVSLNQLSLN
jgi:hypothetical protein